MKYAKYKLYNGESPIGEVFDGGFYPDGEWLFCYLWGSDASINTFISQSSNYEVTVLTENEASNYIINSCPVSTTDMMGRVFYPQAPIVQADGTIRVPWSDAPLGVPDQTARLEAVETTVLDLLLGA